MADKINLGENSPEQVAYKLLLHIAFVEGKVLQGGHAGQKADRDYILKTYLECWDVAHGASPRK